LCARGTRRVCLVDLDLEHGDDACVLGLGAERSLRDAVEWAGELTSDRVASLMTPFRPNLDCLPAPSGPGDAAHIPHTLVEELLSLLPALCDFIVVDTPAHFSSAIFDSDRGGVTHVPILPPREQPCASTRSS
jgi:Flp pilus assembly CpaE family ATPase